MFKDCVIVACGTLNMELNNLRRNGQLNARKIVYTKPGLHQKPSELENQLIACIDRAKTVADRIIVVYGGKFCYVNLNEPLRNIDRIIEEQANGRVKITRVNASHCVDMLASEADRAQISRNRDIYWLTPGWLKYSRLIYEGWDKGMANENFPKHTGGAIMLDGVGYFSELFHNQPEMILEFSDWMGIPMDFYPITLERLIGLLMDAASMP